MVDQTVRSVLAMVGVEVNRDEVGGLLEPRQSGEDYAEVNANCSA